MSLKYYQVQLSFICSSSCLNRYQIENAFYKSQNLFLNEFIHLASVDSPLDIEKSPEIEAVRLKIWNEVTKGIPGSSRSAPAATTTYEAVMEITI